jgi:hypothetical protein
MYTTITAKLHKKNFKRVNGSYYARFTVDQPIVILSTKRPELAIEGHNGDVVGFIDGIGFKKFFIQGEGKTENGYQYRAVI